MLIRTKSPGMVAYVASAEADFVTGASLTIDGGFNA
jgi:3-oxoacyl-[acyl-carrier protein] reductase